MAKIGDVEGILRLRDEFTGVLTRAQSQLQAAGQKMMAVGAGMSQIGGALTRNVTLPLVAIGAVAIKTFSDFDAAMIQSQAIMGDLSDTMKNDMETTAREVAKSTTFSAKEAAESYFFLASAGLDAATSIKALPLVAQFAQAGMFDMATATDLLTDAQSALGLTVRDAATGIVDVTATMENMARVGDVLVKANTLANATVEQFSTSLTREAGAAMKSFNVDIEEGVAVLAAFADQGVKGEIAGTGLSRILRLMTSAAVKNEQAYKDLNVEVFDSKGNLNNLADIIGDLENAFDGMSDRTRTESLELLGFRARVQGVILPLLGTSKSIRRFNTELRDSSGIMKEVATKQLEAFSVKMGLLKDKFIDVAIALGAQITTALEALIPTLEKVAVFLGKATEIFGTLPTPVKLAAVALVGLVAALGPLLIIGGSMLSMFASIAIIAGSGLGFASVAAAAAPVTGVFGSILGVLGGTGGLMGVLGGVVTFLTGPVGIAIAIGAALIAFKPFRDVVFNLVGVMVNLVKIALWPFIEGAKLLWSLVGPLVGAIGDIASALLGQLGSALVTVAGWLSDLNEGFDEVLNQTGTKALESATAAAGGFEESALRMRDVLREMGERDLTRWIENLDESVISVDDLKKGLGILGESGQVTAEEFEFLRQKLISASEAGTTASDAADAFAAALAAMDEDASGATTTLSELDQAMQDMGFVTAKQATGELTSLGAALAGGQVPAVQMKEKINELAEKYEKLGLLDIPQVREALDALNREYEITNGVFDTAISKAARLGSMLDNLPPFIDDISVSADQAGRNIDAMINDMDISKVEPPFRAVADVMRDLGIESTDVAGKVSDLTRLVASGEAPAIQMAQAIATFRDELQRTGQLTPEVDATLQDLRKTALENADAAERGAVGFKTFFDGLQTGIPAVDGIIGKFKGFLGIFSSIVNGLSGVSKGFGDFFGKITGFLGSGGGGGGGGGIMDMIGGLFGGGGGGIPGLGGGGGILSSVTKLIPGLSSIFGGVGAAAATAITTTMAPALATGVSAAFTVGLPAAIPSIAGTASAAGAATGTSMLGGMGASLSGGISSMMGALVPLMTNPFTIGIAAAIGGFFLVKKLMGGPSQLERIGRDSGKFLGLSFSDELAKHIEGMSKGKGLDVGAIFQNLPAIAAEAGGLAGEALSKTLDFGVKNMIISLREGTISAGEFTRDFREGLVPIVDGFIAATKAGEATTSMSDDLGTALNGTLVAVKDGLLSNAEAAAIFHDIWPSLQDNVDQFGQRGVEVLNEVADRMTNLGIVGAEQFVALAESAQTSFDEQQAAAESATQAMKDEMTNLMMVMVGELETGTEEAKIKFENMAIDAALKFGIVEAQAIATAAGVGDAFTSISGKIAGVIDANTAAVRESFDDMGRGWKDTMDEMLGDAEGMKGEMVDNSIIPNMVRAVNTELLTIGTTGALVSKKLLDSFGDVSGPVVSTGLASVSDTLGPVMKTGRLQSSTLRDVEGRGGGKSEPLVVNLVVDGQVLARQMIKNMPRALANAGVANRQR